MYTLFIYLFLFQPTVLNCSHTFCQECINSWTRRVNQCPTCRVFVKNKVYCLTLDTFLDKIIECLPEEVKSRRESLKVERNNNRGNIFVSKVIYTNKLKCTIFDNVKHISCRN